ncbi:MAG: DUF2795 domain-containing protein, partial [Actinomycetota bacterium]|nr:DUF2795 domain-containing protein [Actinomycetota bacterium]
CSHMGGVQGRCIRYVKGHCHMDKLKDLGNAAQGAGIDSQLKDITFPASKDQAIRQLEQKGVPSQVLDRVRSADTSQFDSPDDLKAKVGL